MTRSDPFQATGGDCTNAADIKTGSDHAVTRKVHILPITRATARSVLTEPAADAPCHTSSSCANW